MLPELRGLRSLRLRLLAGFGLVIAISLLLAGSASVWLLRNQQAEAAEQRIGRLVAPLSRYVLEMELVGWRWPRMRAELTPYARAYEIRILVLDSNHLVVVDTDELETLRGETFDILDHDSAPASDERMQPFRSVVERAGGREMYLFTAASPLPGVHADPPREPEATLVIAVPATDVTSAWAQLLPRFAVAGGLAALLAVVVGTVLAGRITRPVAEMTRASEAMAEGEYEQRIEVRGHDEVANLARAFNQMAAQVSRSNRAMRHLLGDVSHELKTPLTSIQGFSQALVEGVATDPRERARLATVIHEEAERMHGLVEDLLYLSQIESGELTLALDAVDVDALVAESAGRLRFQAEAAEVSLRTETAAGAVRGDERRLAQVLANLLDNALRFARAGSEVLVRARREGGEVLISVHNGGEPVPAEDLPHVFDRFYQADRARSGGAHTGLGLAIVSELVQAHGGRVSVESTREAGTTFTVRLPVDGPADGPAEAAGAPGTQGARGGA